MSFSVFAETVCIFEDCTKKIHSKELCQGHYRQKNKGEELKPLRSFRYAVVDEHNKTIKCSSCQHSKPFSDFHKSKKTKIGLTNTCKNCAAKRGREYQVSTYGLSVEEFENMRSRQENKCAICKSVFSGKRLPDIDHDHATKKVRELLCIPCNMLLGKYETNKDWFSLAEEYLEKHGKRN